MILNTLVKLLFVAAVFGSCYGKKKCRPRKPCIQILKEEGIIGDFADTVDYTNVTIVFKNKEEYTARCGNKLPMNQLQKRPKITWEAPSGYRYVTIVLFDPDVADVFAPFLVWMVVNVDTQDLSEGSLGDAVERFEYFGPGLGAPISGNERFIYFLYVHNELIDASSIPNDLLVRFQFDIKKFPEDYDLGNPSAAQFYRIETILDDPKGSVVDLKDPYVHLPGVIGPKGPKIDLTS